MQYLRGHLLFHRLYAGTTNSTIAFSGDKVLTILARLKKASKVHARMSSLAGLSPCKCIQDGLPLPARWKQYHCVSKYSFFRKICLFEITDMHVEKVYKPRLSPCSRYSTAKPIYYCLSKASIRYSHSFQYEESIRFPRRLFG